MTSAKAEEQFVEPLLGKYNALAAIDPLSCAGKLLLIYSANKATRVQLTIHVI